MEPSPQRSDDGVVDLSDVESTRFSPSTVFSLESPSEDNASTSSTGDAVVDKLCTEKKLHEEHEFFLCRSCKRNPTLEGTVPKLLPCLHTFCDTCLKARYLEQRSAAEANGKPCDPNRLRCPSCWQEFYSPTSAIDSFSENQFITEACQQATQPEESTVTRTCTSCDDRSTAVVFCVDCDDWLCSVCHHAHQRVKVTKEHTIQSEEEYNKSLSQSKKQGKARACQFHPNETLKLFCSDCDVLTCRDCQLGQHKDHKYQFMEEAADKHKEVLAKLLKMLEKNVGLLRETLDDVDKAGVGLKVRESMIEAEIKKEMAKLMENLREREHSLIQELKQLTKSKLSLLVKQRKDLKQMSTILRHNYNFATFAVSNGSNTALLCTRKILLTRLNNLNSLRYRQRPLAGCDLKLLLDQEKVKSYFGRIGFIYSQDDIKRKAEAAANRGLPLKAFGSSSSEGASKTLSYVQARNAHTPSSNTSQHAPQLIALSSQGMPYAKVAPTTVPAQSNGKKQNAVIVLQSNTDRQRSLVSSDSSNTMMTQLLKRKFNGLANEVAKQNSNAATTSQSSHTLHNGDPSRREFVSPHRQSPTESSIDRISVTNVTSLNPAAAHGSSGATPPQSSTHTHPPAQAAQIVLVKAEKQDSPTLASCSMAVPSSRLNTSAVTLQGAGNGRPGSSHESTNDDYCAVCRNGGELLCCDTCPRVFHLTCHIPAVIQLPFDTWSCNLCRTLDLTDSEQAQQKRRLPLQGLSEQDTRACEKVLLQIFCHPESTPFHHKVSKAVPNYHQIIAHPMDLTTMRSKLQASHFQRYENINEFCDDMNLIFFNCATFNPPTSEVARMGKTVSAYFQKLAKQCFPHYASSAAEEPKIKRRRDEFILA